MDEEVLSGLERVLTEFFHPSTSNQRKREIEEQLTKFGNQNGSWKQCLEILTKTRNEYVMMYCLSVLENIVNKMWIGFDPSSKAEIRSCLNRILMCHQNIPMFICNKLLKVIVDIGRMDWPMFYPDFFNGLLQLASSSDGKHGDTRVVGLIALRIASEELAAPREDVSAQRKEELKRLLIRQVPAMLNVVTDALHAEWMQHFAQQMVTSMSTPPPSPGSEKASLFDMFCFNAQDATFPQQFQHLPIPHQSLSVMTFSLECLCHLFSWIPLTDMLTPKLLNVVFRYARLGYCSALQNGSSSLSDLGSHAMECINELLAKNFVPHNFEDFLMRIFRQTFHILQQLTLGDDPRKNMERLNDSYLEKFIEFLRLFVSIHFGRIDATASFPLSPFLALLFKFTFNQSSHEHYLNCLDIWEVLIDYIINKSEQSKDVGNSAIDRYNEGMVLFGSAVLQHIQFRCNQTHLDELDNTLPDENSGHTEWKSYLIENLEIIAKVSRLYPNEMLAILCPVLDETAKVYTETNWQFLRQQGSKDVTLHCSLKDLATMLQAFGRLSELFIAEQFQRRYEKALELIQKFLRISHFGCSLLVLQNNSSLPQVFLNDIVEIHAQVLAALQPFTHWMSQLYSEAQQAGHSQAQLSHLLNGYVDVITPVLTKQVPDNITLSAAHTLLSIVTTVRATFLSQSPSIEKLLRDVSNGSCCKLETQTQHLIYKALSNLLLLPWPNTPEGEQKWEARAEHHVTFVKTLLADFFSLANNINDLRNHENLRGQAKHVIHRSVFTLNEIIEAIAEEVAKSRQICHKSIEGCISLSLQLFQIYIGHPDTTEVLMTFFLNVFRALRRQVGVEGIAQIIQLFMECFTQEQLQATILHEDSAGVRVIEKFIKIMELIIDEPGQSFRKFTNNIIHLAIHQIYPIVSQRQSPDVKGALFSLLHHLLLRKHRYFFPSPVIASLLTDGTVNSTKSSTVAHRADFLAILTAFGQSFLQSDISIFKQNLEALEDLNVKQKLYEKLHNSFAEEGVLFQFVNVLLQALINRSHDLLQDDICAALFNMSDVSMEFFFTNFLRQFLQNTVGITPDQKSTLYQAFRPEKDLPSYAANVARFVNDLRYFQLCNSSLPEGTVHF